MTKPFRQRVLQGTPSDTSEKLVSALKELFKELSSQDRGAQSVSTKEVIKALAIQNVYEQQDAVEYFLDILEKAGPDVAEEHRYSLYAVINHSGSRYGGHYTADIRSFTDNKWYCFNDSYVTETSASKLERSVAAYLLLYQKIDSPPAYEKRKETPKFHVALMEPRTEHLLPSLTERQRRTAPSSSVAWVEDIKEEKTAKPREPEETGSAEQCAGAHNKQHLQGKDGEAN
ncbi:hypothetical protein QQF64_019669 [Cirrhinus molitorella]|uniref:USP domain-containing protein n=1 Tax=Cirrhinus molitorella TaxID=172907 RepID=A0ABR3LGA6_9TELE